MNTTNRFWHVGVAIGLALLAVLLTTFYVTNYKRHVQSGEEQVTVLVASKDIPVDTQGGDLLSGTWLKKVTVSRRQVVPGAITSPQQVRGLIATEPIFAGEHAPPGGVAPCPHRRRSLGERRCRPAASARPPNAASAPS